MNSNLSRILRVAILVSLGSFIVINAQLRDIPSLKMAANKGDKEAQYQLGQCYDLGEGCKSNKKEALKWYKKASEQGQAEAQNRLAEFYYNGIGIKKNEKEALTWYKKAAQNGNVSAQLQLGYWYEKGINVQKNEMEAFNWYFKASQSGDKSAQWLVGVCYENGIGVTRNIGEAIKWYEKSANQGYHSAISYLTFLQDNYKINSINDLNKFNISEWSIQELNDRLLTWDEFYIKNQKKKLIEINQDTIEFRIKKHIEEWQVKGEFETTEQWTKRVNDRTRQEEIDKIKETILKEFEKNREEILAEQAELARQYESYKSSILYSFYKEKISRATALFTVSDFELMPYDADHETFMIHSSKYGDILLPVPVSDAPSFKQNWNTIKSQIRPDFIPNGDEVALSKLVFTNNYKDYVYDSHTKANYAITDIKYNFAPIEIADIDIANIQIDDIPGIPEGVASTVVGKTSSEDVLTAQSTQVERINISASEKSNVDTSIPQNKPDNNTNTFAVIIANENYHSVSNVPYASKDGEILEKYLTRAVGLPKDHVKVYKNASFGNIAAALKHIENLSQAFGKDLNLIFYYAGHGIPNEKTKNPMLIPVDGDATIPETCYELDKIITTLGGLDANSVIVMLDACFSGSERGDGMLMAARGIRIKSNQSEPIGNMVILSASQGDETAYPYEVEQHGLFTYFLLKKLQENQGDVTLGELADYITEQVKRQSVISNGKLQTPTVSVSSAIHSIWRNIKLGQ